MSEPQDGKTVTINAAALIDLVRDIFIAAGCSPAEGTRIGTYLVSANLTGHDSHGVIRVPRYLDWLRQGHLIADQEPEIVTDTPVLAVVDGRNGFGQSVAPRAVAIGIDKCKAMGLSAVALRNAGHIGRIGDWAEMAAASGLVSVHFVNAAGSVLVAPFGGAERRMSTAPFCVGIPREGLPPIILDFATSVVAEGKVLVASRGGQPVPGDALIGPDGGLSGDPHLLYGDYQQAGIRDNRAGPGAIRAFGGHKGSGLALINEMLGGALTGNGATREGRAMTNGMMSFYLDPAVVDPDAFMPREIGRYSDYVRSVKPALSGGEVLLPGEPEARMRARRSVDGIPLPLQTWASIADAAVGVGVGAARIDLALKGSQ